MTTRDIQERLAELGYEPGDIDGAMGPTTRKAIKEFQRAFGLDDDGVAGPITLGILFPNLNAPSIKDSIPMSMPWLVEAFRLIDIEEFQGSANNPIIMNWASLMALRYTGDKTPWCGLFTAHCITSQLPGEPIPAYPLGAQNWKTFGKPVAPQFGAMLVFWRVHKDSGKGHVGFYWAEDKTHYHILGGNQNDKVNIARVPKARFLKALWPKDFAPPGFTRHASKQGILDTTSEQ